MWSVCQAQVEAPLHASLVLTDVCWRLLPVCLLWVVLGGCVHALKCCLRPGQEQVSAAASTESHLAVLVYLMMLCLFSGFASIQGGASTEDPAGGCDWKQEEPVFMVRLDFTVLPLLFDIKFCHFLTEGRQWSPKTNREHPMGRIYCCVHCQIRYFLTPREPQVSQHLTAASVDVHLKIWYFIYS